MSSPGLSNGTNQAAELFEDLWRQLRDCHQNVLQELESKVSKLKKERCLDAQRLEVFYSRNQQLKAQNKTLQDAVGLLEERLRAGECDQCGILEENLKKNQEQNLHLITTLKNERSRLQEENRRLHAEVETLKRSCSEPPLTSSPEHEEGIIPDSPVLHRSLPVDNKLRKRKNIHKSQRVRYAELPLPQSSNSLLKEVTKEAVVASKNPGRAEVLVPNTCELDTSQQDVNYDLEEVVAETCVLEPLTNHRVETETTPGWESGSKPPWRNAPVMPHSSSTTSKLIHGPDSTTERSPSLLPRVKRFSEDVSLCKAKRMKEESEPELRRVQVESCKEAPRTTAAGEQRFKKQPLDSEVQSVGNDASGPFKKPTRNWREEPVGGRETTPQHGLTRSPRTCGEDAGRKLNAAPTWSIDPALALSAYDPEARGDEDLVDTDRTWVSHSLLQRGGESSQDGSSASGLGKKANDSLDMMFDTTAYEEYESYNSSHLGEEEEDEDEADDDDDREPDHPVASSQTTGAKARRPTFAHVAVVRKKEERRKLKGTTCKECEIYYAHLPEEEKQKKLSACSRHRFLHVPPCTPENFWEVGFPSTQTCIDRGYVKEEKTPQARLRRRQPLNALFSPKQSQQDI